ncbi:MAG: pyrroline-5-carboxylate reductase [Thiotrichales bacterium SG8_50]|nr:MAG: pyrroline-5-carboxylate reductase [Thiotrichales bacterium SG8_50]
MKIVFVGGGNMAAALIGGMLQQGARPGDLHVIDVSASARDRFSELDVSAHARWDDGVHADVVVFAVKPQNMREVVTGVKSKCRTALVISIAAGIRCADVGRWLGGHERIARVMPNTPALIGAGVSGIFALPGVGADDRKAAEDIIGAAGKTVWFEREAQLDAVTAVSGSGPGYVFYFIEALEEAAIELGIDAQAARLLAIETFRGAAALAASSTDGPAELRARVTSRAGTTERALDYMESENVKSRIVEAVKRAELRARELGDEFGHD